MTAILLRIVIYALIIGFVYFSARKIWRDLKAQFNGPVARPQPNLKQKPPPNVIDLKRDKDGVYRPPGEGR